jgi:hypothetical protein
MISRVEEAIRNKEVFELLQQGTKMLKSINEELTVDDV